MTDFGAIVFSFGGIAMRVYSVLLVIAQLYVLIDVFLQRRGMRAYLLSAVQLLLGLSWFCILLDGSYYVDWVETPRVYPALADIIYSSPWPVVLAVELILTLILASGIYSLARYRRANLSRGVVKETLDMLPVGVCFAEADGTVALKNLSMDSLCRALTGGPLVDAQSFTQKIEQVGEEQNDARIVQTPDGEAVLFLKEEIESNGKPYTQLTAFDVSEQYRIITQLKSKNKKLIDLQMRMKAFNAMTSQLAMSEEILRARVTVHDEMGYLLLIGKYYLDHPESADGEMLLRLERGTHLLLMREGEEPDDAARDSYAEAIGIAGAIGVSVSVSGEPPKGCPARDLLGRAIRECAANTVKHAGGGRLYVSLTYDGGRMNAVLKGDGDAPDGPVTESGGLLNLRRGVESAGGEMTVTCTPQVTVTLSLPTEER